MLSSSRECAIAPRKRRVFIFQGSTQIKQGKEESTRKEDVQSPTRGNFRFRSNSDLAAFLLSFRFRYCWNFELLASCVHVHVNLGFFSMWISMAVGLRIFSWFFRVLIFGGLNDDCFSSFFLDGYRNGFFFLFVLESPFYCLLIFLLYCVH